MQIEQKNINDIKPYERNPRINDNAVEAVAESIKEFGFKVPIVIDKDNVIVTGHTRLLSAKLLGLMEVPCIVALELTPEQIKAYRIADNKTAELAEWDLDLLPLELMDLQDNGYDLSLLGFDNTELENLLHGAEDPTVGMTDPDEIPELPEEAKSQRGEIYQLGNHFLMCGDSTKPDDVEALMQGQKADFWLTDPPYNVNYEGSSGLKIENDNMEDLQFRKFLVDAFQAVYDVLKPGSSFYIFHADSEGYNFRGACHDIGLKVRQCLIWVKNSLVLGRQDFHWIHEPVLYGWKDGAAHKWYNDRSQTTVMHFDKPKKNDVHPTMKTIELLIYLMKNSSKGNDIVIDTFGGSGSTLIAAEQLKRKTYLMEIDPKYCDVIRRRWAEFVHGEKCDWLKLTPHVEAINE